MAGFRYGSVFLEHDITSDTQVCIVVYPTLSHHIKSLLHIQCAVAWAIHHSSVHHLLHYLDDFLLFGQPGMLEAGQAVDTAWVVFAEAGIPVAEHKTEGPATSVTFLGILVDATFQLQLPTGKLARLQVMVCQWLDNRPPGTVIPPGHIFCALCLLLLQLLPNFIIIYVHLNLSVQANLRWWLHHLQSWNGLSFFPPPLPSVHVYSDASGSFGCGTFSRPHGWFQLQWPPTWLSVNIATKEFVPVITAAALWGKLWAGLHVYFHMDTWLWCLFSTSSLQRTPFCPTFCDACSFSLPFISFTSLPNIFLAF